MSNPTGDAIASDRDANIKVHQAAIAEAEHTADMLRDAANACTKGQLSLHTRLLAAARVIEHLLPLHRKTLETALHNKAVSEAIQKTVDYKNTR